MRVPDLVAVCLALLYSSSSPAAGADGVVCYDAKNVISTIAPEGWVVDYDKGHQLGVCAMLYPQGRTFDDAPAVLYPKLVTTAEPLANFIEGDLEKFERKGAKVEILPALIGAKGLSFELRRLTGGPAPNEQELIAYCLADQAVVLAVASARTPHNLAVAEPSFRQYLATFEQLSRAGLHKALLARADADEVRPSGAAYQAQLMKALASRLAQAMGTCAKPGSQGFVAVLQISFKGAIVGWSVVADDPVSSCVRRELRDFKAPVPPFEPFHLKLEMRVAG